MPSVGFWFDIPSKNDTVNFRVPTGLAGACMLFLLAIQKLEDILLSSVWILNIY